MSNNRVKKFNEHIHADKLKGTTRIIFDKETGTTKEVPVDPTPSRQASKDITLLNHYDSPSTKDFDVDEYNNSLLQIDPKVQQLKLVGNKVLVRLFKMNTKTNSGLYVPKMDMSLSESGKAKYHEDATFNFNGRGVVVAISDECSESFRSKVKVGSIVDIVPGLNLPYMLRFIDKVAGATPDNYFMINEHQVDWVN